MQKGNMKKGTSKNDPIKVIVDRIENLGVNKKLVEDMENDPTGQRH